MQRKAMFANMNSGQNKFSYAPVYAAGDISAMGVDAIGTAGATTVSMVPLLTTLGIGYIGASMALSGKNKLEKQYKNEKKKSKKKKYSARPVNKYYVVGEL